MKLFICFDAGKLPQECCSGNDIILMWSKENDTVNKVSATVFEAINFTVNISLGPLAAAVRSFFEDHRNETVKNLMPFANNFYDCSIMPLYKYINAMIYLLDTYNISEIIFDRKIAFASAGPNYYLSEHESHSVRLYSRASSMQPCLEAVAASRNIPVAYVHKTRVYSVQKIANKLRLMSVFTLKFFIDLQKKLRKVNPGFKKSVAVNYVFNIRNYSQFQFICHLLTVNKRYLVAAYEGFFASGLASSIANNFSSYQDTVQFHCNYTVAQLLRVYGRSLFHIITLPNTSFRFNELNINVTQALRECLVMNAELMLYRHSLNGLLKNIDKEPDAIFFSTEQKSPHAWIDAKIAGEHGYQVVHLMQCDQSTLPIPNPVPGDLYVTDSRLRLEEFHRENESFANKFAFVGSIKSVSPGADLQAARVGPTVDFCFFSNVDDTDLNRKVLDTLYSLEPDGHFIVKLHPRDSGAWLKKNEKARVYHEGDLGRQVLFSLFRVAISFPSGVITDLIGMAKPVVILDVKKLQVNYGYLHQSYKFLVKHTDQLACCLSDIAAIEHEFNRVMSMHETGEALTAVKIIEAIESRLLKEDACVG